MKIEIADLSNLYMQITSDAKMWRLVTTPIISRLLGVNFNMIKSDCLGGKCFSERKETIIFLSLRTTHFFCIMYFYSFSFDIMNRIEYHGVFLIWVLLVSFKWCCVQDFNMSVLAAYMRPGSKSKIVKVVSYFFTCIIL